MKHLKHKSETPKTLETLSHRWPWAIWWGTVASKLGFKGTSRATAGDLLVAPGWWWRFARHGRDERGGLLTAVDASRVAWREIGAGATR
jgi:hypothetical protein